MPLTFKIRVHCVPNLFRFVEEIRKRQRLLGYSQPNFVYIPRVCFARLQTNNPFRIASSSSFHSSLLIPQRLLPTPPPPSHNQHTSTSERRLLCLLERIPTLESHLLQLVQTPRQTLEQRLNNETIPCQSQTERQLLYRNG